LSPKGELHHRMPLCRELRQECVKLLRFQAAQAAGRKSIG